MNRLSTEKRVQVVAALIEGNSINAVGRMTGVAKHTILKLLEDMGCACAEYHHRHVQTAPMPRGTEVKEPEAIMPRSWYRRLGQPANSRWSARGRSESLRCGLTSGLLGRKGGSGRGGACSVGVLRARATRSERQQEQNQIPPLRYGMTTMLGGRKAMRMFAHRKTAITA